MGKRGPKPQPTKLKIARGNPGQRRLNDSEPEPPTEGVQHPDYLAGDSLKKWQQIFPIVQEMKVMTVADSEALARYCVMWEQWLKCLQSVQQGNVSYTVLNPDGSIKRIASTPEATLLLSLSATLLRIEQEFGLTPSARAGLHVSKPEEANPLKAFGITG